MKGIETGALMNESSKIHLHKKVARRACMATNYAREYALYPSVFSHLLFFTTASFDRTGTLFSTLSVSGNSTSSTPFLNSTQ